MKKEKSAMGKGVAYTFILLMVCTMLSGLPGTAMAASEFNIGDTVEVTDNLNVRICAGTDNNVCPEITDPDYPGSAPKGTLGKILSGPSSGDGYIWWKVDFGPGLYSGWSVENYLETPCPHSCWDRSALSGNELATLVRNHFPPGGVTQTGESIRVTAYAVAMAESHEGNPSACGDPPNQDYHHSNSIGLWQIYTPVHPYDKCRLFEEDYNANAAKEISNNGTNWNPWCTWEETACGGNGDESYKNYLVEARKHFYPKVMSLSVSQTSINLGEAVKIYYSVSDDVGLSRVELWRTVDKNGDPDPSLWEEIKRASISGTSYSDYFTDTPTPPGIYWYGIHVVDNSGAPEAWNDEKNSRTGCSPGVYGPIKVTVSQPTYPPQVTTNAATNVEETTTTIHGTVSNDGGEACQYRFGYSTTQGGPYTYESWSTDTKTTGQSFSQAISGLSKGTKYYFRAQAKNSAGTASGSELSFLTKPDAPTSFSATTAGTTQIDISWAKGDGAQKTKIQRKQGSYPSNRNDGTQVYFGIGSSKSDTGLTPGTTYYYRAWSYAQGSEQWSDNYAQDWATTGGVINPPTVTNDGGATDVTSNSARLWGEVTSTGGENPTVYIYWGNNDGGTTTANWDYQENLGTKGAGTFHKDITELNLGTTYYYRCYAENSAGSDWADSTASFTTLVPSYCSCGGTIYDMEWISRVQFNNIDKSSGGDGYADYTSISTDVARGSTYILKVTIGQTNSWPEYVKAYFDWNQDLDFEDSGEGIGIGHCSSNGCIVSANINIPSDATLGSTKMRIVQQYSTYHDPCGSYTYGDTEDYIVNIILGGVINPPTVTNNGGATDVTSNSARLRGEVTSTGGEDPILYIHWGDNDGGTTAANWDHQENLGIKGAGTFYKDISGLNLGTTYYYRCYAENSAGSDWADSTASFTTSLLPPPVYCSCAGTIYDEEWISRVQFNTIDKGSIGSGYADYTSISTDVVRGGTYTLKVTIGQIDSWPEYVKAYFDWNQDLDFEDSGEGIEIGYCSSDGCIVSANIDIPSDATLGSTRMRIVHQYYSYHGPCGSYTYGGTEDYTVNIVPAGVDQIFY